MSKHTPGPWKYRLPHDAYGHEIVSTSRLICHVSQINTHPKELERVAANARLIAAAPTLLRALKNASTWFGKLTQDEHDGANLENMKALARAAIAQAEEE